MEGKDPIKIYRQIIQVIGLAKDAYGPYKKQIFLMTALSIMGGILEGIGINAVIPLLTFVLQMQNPATDMISVAIRAFFDLLHIPFVPRYLLGFIVVLFIGKSIMTFLLTYVQIKITVEYERATRAELFSLALHSSWPYLLKQKLGNLETVLMVDTPVSVAMFTKISFAITVITSLLMYLIVAFSISSTVTLMTFGLGVLVFVTLRPLMDRVHGISAERATVYRDTMHHAGEHMSGLKTVKAYAAEDSAIQRGEQYFQKIKSLAIRVSILHTIAAQVVAPIGVLYIAAILALSLKTPIISFAALPAILYLIYRIFSYVQQLQNNIQYISEQAPHLERVLAYKKSAQGQSEVVHGEAPFAFSKELSFESVTFSYDNEREVLSNVSFSVKKGTMLGIVGPSGSGKTTCVDLMLRLLVPSSGTIKLDGVNAGDIKLADWRRHIAYVSQEFFLLEDTIANNIRFYDESITDDDVWRAAEMAHIDDFIKSCPEGLETQVGDRGIRLSAGQRQRIVIARAMARKPDILILDEATSSLDAESEAHIKRAIDDLKGKVTIIAIAHRLSTIVGSDRLIVLQDGELVESGTPKELLNNEDSYFFKVHSISQ